MTRGAVLSRIRSPILVGLTALACAFALSGCGKKKPTLGLDDTRPVELIYNTGAERLDSHHWTDAVDYFHEVEQQFPYSEWARRAVLMTAFAHYQANDYESAVTDADRFISLYPGNSSAVYAYYLKAICYFEQITDVGRDQATTEQALSTLREVIRRFPNSQYAVDARLKIDMVNDQLAGKEMSIGRFYEREGQPVAAIGRFRSVIDKYQTTSHAPEALYRLVESYLSVGLTEEAKRNAAVLGYNYPGDRWYSDAYALMQGKGLKPVVEPVKTKHTGGIRLPSLPFTHGKALKPPTA